MRLSVAVLTAALVTGSLVACSNGNGVPQTASTSADGSAPKTSVTPADLRSSEILAKMQAAAGGRADAVTPGIYASVGHPSAPSYIYGYLGNDSSNGSPVCSVSVGNHVDVNVPVDVAVDGKGDLLAISSATNRGGAITVYAGPGLCGPKLGTIADSYGIPDDVASRNAKGGKIVVANLVHHVGVSVCTLSRGCTAELKIAGARAVLGVALAPNGDCWASGYGFYPVYGPALAYFAHCRGRGVLATGFQPNGGAAAGLDIDDNGNLVVLVTVAYRSSELYIYSGCNPSCSLVGGPFQLQSRSEFGHLDASSKHFVAPRPHGLDVYSYSTSGIKYEYSISNGLTGGVEGAAFSPSSKE